MSEMRLWMKAVPLAPVSSSTRFLSAQAQSSVEYSACVHKATLLQSPMSLTNGLSVPPFTCGHANVVPSTMGHRLLLSTPSRQKGQKKITTPGVPRLSPTLVLTRPEEA